MHDERKMIVCLLRGKVSNGLASWVEDQFSLGADVEDIERSLTIAAQQIKRAKDHFASRSDREVA